MKTIQFFLLFALAALISSCSSVTVVADMDKSVDFSAYKTYTFLGWQEDSGRILNDFDKKRLRDAFVSEFEARGMKAVPENGDIDITLFIVVDQKTSVTAYTNYYGGGYGVYSRYGGGWGYGSSSTSYSENDYLEGTLVMDIFDGQSKSQVWQGIAKSAVDENPDKRDQSIPAKVSALMKKYPIQPKE